MFALDGLLLGVEMPLVGPHPSVSNCAIQRRGCTSVVAPSGADQVSIGSLWRGASKTRTPDGPASWSSTPEEKR